MEGKRKKIIKINEDIRGLLDNVKCQNFHIIGVPEEDRKKSNEKIFEEIIVGNFP